MANENELVINGETYRRVGPSGTRCVVVLDRGWIFAGDVQTSEDGRLRMTRVLHVLRWERNGFAGMCADPAKAGAVLHACDDLDAPSDCELFRVPVGPSWGL